MKIIIKIIISRKNFFITKKMDDISLLKDILKNLIKINKGFDDKNLIDKNDFSFLKKFLEENSFEVKILENENEASSLIAIYYGNLQNKKNIDLAFLGHLDVVDPGDHSLWKNKNPFELHKDGSEILYGRGSVDMKSSIASFLLASSNFLKNYEKNINFNLAILITGDEEKNSESAISLAKYIQNESFCIKQILIGEPTSEKNLGDVIKNGRRGSANFDLFIYGVEGHAAYPEFSKNPIENHLPEILNDLKSINFNDSNEFYENSNLVITSLKSLPENIRNVTPFEVKISFNIRYNSSQTLDSLKALLAQIIKKNNILENSKLNVFSNFAPFFSKKTEFSKNLTDSIKKITGIDPNYKTNGGTSDGRFFHHLAPIIEFGPLNCSAHKINEFISSKDLHNLYKIYFLSLENLNKNL